MAPATMLATTHKANDQSRRLENRTPEKKLRNAHKAQQSTMAQRPPINAPFRSAIRKISSFWIDSSHHGCTTAPATGPIDANEMAGIAHAPKIPLRSTRYSITQEKGQATPPHEKNQKSSEDKNLQFRQAGEYCRTGSRHLHLFHIETMNAKEFACPDYSGHR